MQFILTGSLTVAAVILGAVAVNMAGDKHISDLHKRLGYAILALVLFQLSLGWWIHRAFASNRTRRPIRNVAHIVLGVALISMGYMQVYKGALLCFCLDSETETLAQASTSMSERRRHTSRQSFGFHSLALL